MQMVRRRFLHLAGAATALLASPYVVRAQQQAPGVVGPPTRRSAHDRLEEALIESTLAEAHEFAETDPLTTKNQTFGEALDLATGCAAFQQQLLPHRPRRRWARSTRHCRAQRYL